MELNPHAMDDETLRNNGFEQIDGFYKLILNKPSMLDIRELTAELYEDGTLYIEPVDVVVTTESRLKRLIFNLTN